MAGAPTSQRSLVAPPSRPVTLRHFFRQLAALGCAASLALTSRARASDGQWALSLGAGPARLEQSGWGVHSALRVGYGWGEYVELDLQATGFVFSVQPESQTAQAVTLGATYRLDVIQWVPYLGVRGGWSLVPDTTGREQAPLASVHYGIDRLLSRSWAIGGVLEHSLFVPESRSLWAHAARAVLTFRFAP